jgi:spore coat protein U-like protein
MRSATPVSYSIALSPGFGSYSDRTMTSGAIAMHYNLYTDASYSQIWGDTTSGTSVVGDSFTLAAASVMKNYPIYSRILGSQRLLKAGTYGDSLLLTLTF